jgi:hypothetical protein
MRNKLSNVFGKSALPALIAGVVLAFGAPAAGLAAERGGGGGHFSGGGHGFSSGSRGGANVYRGGGGANYAYRGGGAYRGGYYRGGTGVYLGIGGGYGYAPRACGFYDAYGYWHPAPGCYNGAYGY